MKNIKQMEIKAEMTVGQLVDEMNGSGVLGAGKLAKAVAIIVEMFRDPEYTNFLSLAGPMVPGGLRKIISILIKQGYIDAIVASGANVVHDIIEALGYKGVKGSFRNDDVELRTKGVGRAGDIYFEQRGFEALEKKMYMIFDGLQEDKGEIAFHELLNKIGKELKDQESFLKEAAIQNVPVFSPGIIDSMLGLHLWTYNQIRRLQVDPLLDLNKMADIIYSSKKIGVIILGGGLPKHHVLGASVLCEGVDAAIQITLDRAESGSLSGAPLEEAISWKKAKTNSKLTTVIGDASVLFPIMIAAALEKLHEKKL